MPSIRPFKPKRRKKNAAGQALLLAGTLGVGFLEARANAKKARAEAVEATRKADLEERRVVALEEAQDLRQDKFDADKSAAAGATVAASENLAGSMESAMNGFRAVAGREPTPKEVGFLKSHVENSNKTVGGQNLKRYLDSFKPKGASTPSARTEELNRLMTDFVPGNMEDSIAFHDIDDLMSEMAADGLFPSSDGYFPELKRRIATQMLGDPILSEFTDEPTGKFTTSLVWGKIDPSLIPRMADRVARGVLRDSGIFSFGPAAGTAEGELDKDLLADKNAEDQDGAGGALDRLKALGGRLLEELR